MTWKGWDSTCTARAGLHHDFQETSTRWMSRISFARSLTFRTFLAAIKHLYNINIHLQHVATPQNLCMIIRCAFFLFLSWFSLWHALDTVAVAYYSLDVEWENAAGTLLSVSHVFLKFLFQLSPLAQVQWLRRCLVKYEMQYIRAWEIEEKRRQREIADLEAMRSRFQKDWNIPKFFVVRAWWVIILITRLRNLGHTLKAETVWISDLPTNWASMRDKLLFAPLLSWGRWSGRETIRRATRSLAEGPG